MNCSPTGLTVEDLHKEIDRLQKQLMEAEKRSPDSRLFPYHQILEELPDLLCLFRPDGSISYANTAFCSCIGKSGRETVGNSLFGCLPRNDRKRFLQRLSELAPHKPIQTFEYRVNLSGREARWYHWTLKALFDHEERPESYILTGRDITILKGIEEDLIDALEKYATLFESTNDAIVLIDRDRLIDCNTAALKVFRSVDKEEFLQGGFLDFSFPGPAGQTALGDDFHRHIARALKIGMERFEWQCRRADGSMFLSDIILSPFPLGARRVVAAIIRDISDLKNTEKALRKAHDELEEKVRDRTKELCETNDKLLREIREHAKTEADLRRSEERYRRISEELDVVLNGITDIILLNDRDMNIIWANRAASEISGLPVEEIQGRKCYEALRKKSVPCEQCPVVQAVGTASPREGTMKTSDGTLWEIMSYPVRDERGSIRGAIAITRNITDRKAAEEEAQKRCKLDSLATLAGGIAHDFNNILTVIMGNVSFAKMLISNEDRIYGKLDDIERASLKAKELTSQLMTFSKGGMLQRKPVMVDQILRDTVHFTLEHSDITARFHIAEDLWRADADEVQLGQVIRNIVLNAKEAMPHGGAIVVEARNCSGENEKCLPIPGGNYVEISIRDTGSGIDESILGNIFDPFFTTKQKCSGLGLTTSYSIMKKHGGHICASSFPGNGATLTLYLPAAIHTGQEEEQPREFQEACTGSGRILFMDDEAFIRDLAMGILSHLGYELTFAREGSEAIEAYRMALEQGKRFDAVILDLTVAEGMGGKECIRELRKIDPDVRAIVSSGYTSDPIMTDPQRFGFSAFIAKPYNIQTLSTILKKTIGER
ncbi:MAG TPA: PAS domain-containing protein [Desulfomonilia bacterium]|mgnify:CR=1 FL=1|nr:PAS domain-containing protein [Desulfomonilia bacterium]